MTIEDFNNCSCPPNKWQPKCIIHPAKIVINLIAKHKRLSA